MSCFNDVCNWNKDMVMQLCSRCRKAIYCSRDCQKKHWPDHKKICGVVVNPIKFIAINVGGRGGLFADRDIYRSECIVEEKCILSTQYIKLQNFDNEQQGIDAKVSELNILYNNLSEQDKSIYDSFGSNYPEADRVYGIFKTNSVSLGDDGAIFPTISHCNHACIPNSAYVYDEETKVMKLIAVKDIEEGTEITCSYLGNMMIDIYRRKKLLRERFGFICECRTCKNFNNSTDKGFEQYGDLCAGLPYIIDINPPLAYENCIAMMKFCTMKLNDIMFKSVCYDMFKVCARLEMLVAANKWFKYYILITRLYLGDESSIVVEDSRYIDNIIRHPTYVSLSREE